MPKRAAADIGSSPNVVLPRAPRPRNSRGTCFGITGSPRRQARKYRHFSGVAVHACPQLVSGASVTVNSGVSCRSDTSVKTRCPSAQSLTAGEVTVADSHDAVESSAVSSGTAEQQLKRLPRQLDALWRPFIAWLSSLLRMANVTAKPEVLLRQARDQLLLLLEQAVAGFPLRGEESQASVLLFSNNIAFPVQTAAPDTLVQRVDTGAHLFARALRKVARLPKVRLTLAWLQALVRAIEPQLYRTKSGVFIFKLGGAEFPALREAVPKAPARRKHVRFPSHGRAFVALLHGSEERFFVYALLVGHCLARLGRGADRVLLCSGRWWQDKRSRAALRRVYTFVKPVRLIHAAHATWARRHSKVFTKIQALRLPYRHLLFLDLDLVVRADPSPLFGVKAPAGLYHGGWDGPLEHGELISTAVGEDDWWCVNAGVMRLDPATSRADRQDEVDNMMAEVRHITRKTMLPEQYYLARRLNGWRHIDPCWNMEVGPHFSDPGFSEPLDSAKCQLVAPRGTRWLQQDVQQVNIFHFSGTNLEPWWYVDVSVDQAYAEAELEWRHRDPRRLVAVAIREWREALEKLLSASEIWPETARAPLLEAVGSLREQAADYRVWRNTSGAVCYQCHDCKRHFVRREGRWLSPESDLWSCSDCAVASILG
uniref:Uncharacterized protein n=1 Tax=Noctiluca scintillans TaxID=2966 RepID=A0A7S1FH92_NOCSC